MAVIGSAIAMVESGFTRYDDLDSNISYLGSGWSDYVSFSSKHGDSTKVNSTTSNSTIIQFNFIGSKIRTYGAGYSGMNTGNTIIIDGVSYNMALWSELPNNGIGLSFEKTDLAFKEHYVQIVYNNSTRMYLDAIDIDSTGQLKLYNTNPPIDKYYFTTIHPEKIKTNLLNMNVGDVIKCRYSAQNGQLGIFSELGTTTKSELSTFPSATPDGFFYWIFVGYDTQNRMKFIADRNIQHSISYDTLNSNGVVTGLPIVFSNYPAMNFTIRLMTGGASSSDTSNEWDAIIVGYDLNFSIVAGDDWVWNYSSIQSWTGTIYTGTNNATVRGGSATVFSMNNLATSTANNTVGFRPVLLVEIPQTNYLLKDINNNIYSQVNGKIVNLGNKAIDYNFYKSYGGSILNFLANKNLIVQEQLSSSTTLDTGTLFTFPLNKNQYYSAINGVSVE